MNKNVLVYLRKPTWEDKSELETAYKRSESLHTPFTVPPTDINEYINHTNRYLLCHKENQTIVGSFNISNIVRGWFQSGYVGYEVFTPFQKQGLMYQGLLLLLDEAFIKLNLHRLEANIQANNIASIKLAAKAGFVQEGFSKSYLRVGGKHWQDHERWAIINKYWEDPDFK